MGDENIKAAKHYFDDQDMIRSIQDISSQRGTAFVVVIDEWNCIFRDKLSGLLAGDRLVIDPGHFQDDMTTFLGAGDVLTLLIHLGYLGHNESDSTVFIPNHEIQMEFVRAMDDSRWDEVNGAVKK